MRSEEQLKRARILYGLAGGLGFAAGLFLLWALRALILPTIVGALSAYICRPLIRMAKRYGIPHKLAVFILVGAFVCGIGLIVAEVRAFMGDEQTLLVLRVRGQYKLNERFEQARERLPEWSTREMETFLADLNRLIALTPPEQELFALFLTGRRGVGGIPERYVAYHQANLSYMEGLRRKKMLKDHSSREGPAKASKKEEASAAQSFVGAVLNVLSIWVVMPFVFLFLLFDRGDIVKGLVSFVPNKYFEVTLTVIHNVDRALGAYLRGVTLECGLVGLTFVVCLWFCGIDLRVALLIGFVAGAANAIPFLGPAIGLIVGAAYALVVEDISPMLPFITPDNLIVGIMVTVAVAQGLDNAYFQPVVLGTAVDLHPLLVIFGVMGGSILFGMAGMLLAIPTIVIVKVVMGTLFKELKAYSII